jgi:hypothetical protein
MNVDGDEADSVRYSGFDILSSLGIWDFVIVLIGLELIGGV